VTLYPSDGMDALRAAQTRLNYMQVQPFPDRQQRATACGSNASSSAKELYPFSSRPVGFRNAQACSFTEFTSTSLAYLVGDSIFFLAQQRFYALMRK